MSHILFLYLHFGEPGIFKGETRGQRNQTHNTESENSGLRGLAIYEVQ